MAELRDPINEDPEKRIERLRKQRILNKRFRRTRGQYELGTFATKKNTSLADFVQGQVKALGLSTFFQVCHSSQPKEIKRLSAPDVTQMQFDDQLVAGGFSTNNSLSRE